MTNKTNPEYYSKYNVSDGSATYTPMEVLDKYGFILGNVGKYLLRYEDKGHSEDLKKALTYLENWPCGDLPSTLHNYGIKEYTSYLEEKQPLLKFLSCASEAQSKETKAFLLDILKERIEELIEVEPENEESAPIQFCKINNEFLAFYNNLFDNPKHNELFKESLEDFEEYKKNAVTLYNFLKDGVDPECEAYKDYAEKVFIFLYTSWLSTYMSTLILTGTIDPVNQLAIITAVSNAADGDFDLDIVDEGVIFFNELLEDNPDFKDRNHFSELLVAHKDLFTNNKFLELSDLLEMHVLDEN